MSKRKRRGLITAGELMAELEADPEWRATDETRRLGREAAVRRNMRDAAPLMEELRGAGFEIDWISDLSSRELITVLPSRFSLSGWGGYFDRDAERLHRMTHPEEDSAPKP